MNSLRRGCVTDESIELVGYHPFQLSALRIMQRYLRILHQNRKPVPNDASSRTKKTHAGDNKELERSE